jgi:hypothetical protein
MSAVIVITSHGDIQVKSSKNPNETEEVEKYRFPRDMTIVSLNAVSPSVPNLLPPKNVAPFVKIVRDNTSIFNGRTSKKDMKNIVKIIREQILEMDDQPEDARTQVHSGNTYYTNDGEIMAYHYHSHELLYKIKTYTNGMIYNKEFLRDLVIFNNTLPLKAKKSVGFSIQWGFVPHPIIPIIHAWLKRIDTSFERTQQRTEKVKMELIETTANPIKYSLNIEGL